MEAARNADKGWSGSEASVKGSLLDLGFRRSFATSVVRFNPSILAAALLLPLVRRNASSISRYCKLLCRLA